MVLCSLWEGHMWIVASTFAGCDLRTVQAGPCLVVLNSRQSNTRWMSKGSQVLISALERSGRSCLRLFDEVQLSMNYSIGFR